MYMTTKYNSEAKEKRNKNISLFALPWKEKQGEK